MVDEAHRSTFGDMLITIKDTFPHAIFFGFTGTPILEENEREMNTTATVFGDELHRYSIADGIRDKNVLGFDPYKVLTYADKDLRQAIALEKARASSVEEAIDNPEKSAIYYKFMRSVNMAGSFSNDGKYIKGIEDYVPVSQYNCEKHRKAVVQDILENWKTLSHNSKFHAILATSKLIIDVLLNETTYKILALRYKELQGGGGNGGGTDLPYDIATHLIEIDTDVIDADYMNSRFEKYLKVIEQPNVDKAEQENTLNELHKSFAMLSQEEQKFANIFLHDVQRGDVVMEKGKSFRDYITEYIATAKNDQISKVARALGLDATQLRNIMESDVSETNLNEFGRFDELIKSVDKTKAKEYFEAIEKTKIPLPKINIRVHKLLRDFILSGGTDITEA